MSDREAKRPRVTLIAKGANNGASSRIETPPPPPRATNALEVRMPLPRSERTSEASTPNSLRPALARPGSRLRPAPATIAAQKAAEAGSSVSSPVRTSTGALPVKQTLMKKPLTTVVRPKAAGVTNGTALSTSLAAAGPQRVLSKVAATSVFFDVSNQLFRVPLKLVRSKPETLLAKLLADGSNGAGTRLDPIGVEVAPERFGYILDWYRYDELFLPGTANVDALLRDARQLELPDEVIVNGVLRSTRLEDSARKVGQTLVATVIRRWPSFAPFFAHTLAAIKAHFQTVAENSTSSEAKGPEDPVAEEAFDFPRFVMPIFGEEGWLKPKQICTTARARVVALKLEELGYVCEFTDSELVVSLPLRLSSEVAGHSAGDDAHGEEVEDGVPEASA